MSDSLLSVAIYSYCGCSPINRLAPLLWSVRNLGGEELDIVVAQDFDGSVVEADRYHAVCQEYGAEHVRMTVHGHMSQSNFEAVEATDTPWVLVCSDDVLLPKGFLTRLIHCLGTMCKQKNSFIERIAGMYVHCWDRNEIEAMGRRGNDPYVPELSGFSDKMFYGLPPEHPDWWWRRIGYQLPEPRWSEPTPNDCVGIVPSVHGSAYVVNRRYWDMIGGCAGIFCWQNDSVTAARINNWTDGFIVRLPGLPSLAHRGAGAPSPSDPSGKWLNSSAALCNEHGAAYRELPDYRLASGDSVPPIEKLEAGWRLRAYSLHKRFEREIASLDMSYRTVFV